MEEHFLDFLCYGRHNSVSEQCIKTAKQQRTDYNRNQNLYAAVMFGQFLNDGEKTHFYREDFAGIIDEQHIPQWATEKMEQIQAQQEQQEQEAAPVRLVRLHNMFARKQFKIDVHFTNIVRKPVYNTAMGAKSKFIIPSIIGNMKTLCPFSICTVKYLPSECTENAVKEFGYDRTMWVVANTINERQGVRRIYTFCSAYIRCLRILHTKPKNCE